MTPRAVLIAALGALPLLCAAPPARAQSALKGHDTDAPADVTADRIEVQDRANRAIFTGSVHVKQGDMTMDAARMTVAYRKATMPGSDGEIQRIDASGGVTVIDPSERATGDFGTYDLDRRIITLIGNVTLTRAANRVNGARLVIDLNTGRSTVDGNAVAGGAPGAIGSSGGRVTGHFTVPKRTTPATPAPPPK